MSVPSRLGRGTLPALLVLAACGGEPAATPAGDAPPAPLVDDDVPRSERVARLMSVLAADSMEGRAAGTEGERRARDFLVAELERYGVRPAGEEGYLQAVPLVRARDRDGRIVWRGIPPDTDMDTVPETDRGQAWNVLGIVPGAHPELARDVVIVGAHYDHVGIGRPNAEGDSIYNGADDDASGTVASLEIARALARGERPARSVMVALFSAEEIGLLGPRHWLENPTIEVDRLIADLQIELIGRPDPAAGGPGGGWLTGYELSTLGDQLAAAGSRIVPDPRPEQRFFFRSDNLPFARRGIPAHTLSSYNMHGDYHTPDDELEGIDIAHMTSLVDAAEAMVRTLAAGEVPTWHGDRSEVGQLGLRGPFSVACPDGTSGSALFVEGPPSEAWLTFEGERRLIAQVEAASGARYEGEGVLFWTREEEATLEIGGEANRTCTLRPPATTP